jgi:toxin ParE1/3/4
MKSRVLWDRDAERDIDGIWDYIAKESPAAANRVVGRILSTCGLLAKQPHMGQARPELGRDLRSFSVGNYVVFFRPDADGIGVARVLHAARDVDAQFPR